MSYSLPSQHYTTPQLRLTLYLVNIIPHLYHVLLFTLSILYHTSIMSYSLREIIFPGNPKLWNDLAIIIRNSPSVHIFKMKLKLKYIQFPRPPTYHFTGNRKLNILHARLRQKCSSLRSDLFRSNLIENPICSCGAGPETAEHYILYCTKYVTARNKLKNNIELINIPFVLNVLLYGDEGESHETNSSVFQQVQLFIKKMGHFID